MTAPASGRTPTAVWVLVMFAAALASLSYSVYKTRLGDWWWLWPTAPLGEIRHESGLSYQARTGRPDLSSHERPSPAVVVEDGRLLGPAFAQHADIRASGQGRFSFWHDDVYFSSSDGSDPRTNGRSYSFRFAPVGRAAARLLYFTTVIVGGVTLVLLAWQLRRLRLRDWPILIVSRAAQLSSRLTGGALRAVAGVLRAILGRRRAGSMLVIVWVVVGLLAAASEVVYLTRTAQWTWLWTEAPLGAISPETGFAYVGHTGREDLGSHRMPSPAAIYEDGRQLGLRNAQHADIRTVGRGRYSFWYDYVYFATTDNSDPRSNGRRYTMRFPRVSRAQARVLYSSAGLLALVALLLTAAALSGQMLGQAPAAMLRAARTNVVFGMVAIGAASVAGIALVQSSADLAPLARDLWWPVLLINAVAAWMVRLKFGPRIPVAIAAAFLVALGAGFYLLTARAPHRTQGCHVTDPISIWDGFCISPDSTSYYYGHQPGSTRQPLYPWFIGVTTAGTGFDPQAYTAAAQYGKLITDSREPLFRVVRTQIVLLLAAALVACGLAMWALGSTLPAVAFLWLYDTQFLSAGEINVVLTETLVMTFQFLLVAAFLAFLAEKRRGWLLSAAVFCGLAYLTRQASAYSALMLVVLILVALAADRRRWWRSCVAALAVFAALASVPDLYTFVLTGSISKQQQSLQYQYRIAHAMQYATLDDLTLMPDEESRVWLADAVRRRDLEHRAVEAKFGADEYNRLVYYINANLYSVATPPGLPAKSPQFYMGVATPILIEHWTEYARFSFRFWQVALTWPGIARLGLFGYSPWLTYGAIGLLALALRDRRALAAVTFVGCHWAAVALTCLFAAPIPRMVWATEFFVVLAGVVLIWGAAERTIERQWAATLFARFARRVKSIDSLEAAAGGPTP